MSAHAYTEDQLVEQPATMGKVEGIMLKAERLPPGKEKEQPRIGDGSCRRSDKIAFANRLFSLSARPQFRAW